MRALIEHVTHPDQAFRLLALDLATFDGGLHRHPQFELTWIERGSGLRFVGDSVEPFENGDLVLLGPELPHAWVGKPAPGGASCRAVVLQFAPGLLLDPLLPELQALRPLLAHAQRGMALEGPGRERLVALLAAMPELDPLARLAQWLLLLRELGRHGEWRLLSARAAPAADRSPAEGKTAERKIDRLLTWLQAHLAEPVCLADAAEVVHIIPAAFSRYFRRSTGKTFVAYMNDLRCSEACVQLRQSSASVAQIASACGFVNFAHFARQFKRRMGLSPSAYRAAAPGP
jgi:AraC-like DNA-binding protein